MIPDGGVHIGCLWPGYETSFENLARKCVAFANRLGQIHPLFYEFSPIGAKSGYSNMLKQPLISNIDDAGWRSMFEKSLAGGAQLVGATFWNRRPSKHESLLFTVTVVFCEKGVIPAGLNGKIVLGSLVRLASGVAVNDLPPALSQADHLTAILQATVEVFGGRRADLYTYWQNDAIRARYWRLWLHEEQPWPSNPGDRFKLEQGKHSLEESWLGGTLYTWPEYEPWRYRRLPGGN